MKPMSEAAKGMTKAIEYMNEHGWCKHALKNEAGEVCIYGAFDYSDSTVFSTELSAPVSLAIKELRPNLPYSRCGLGIVEFNNHHNTTYEDVKKVMQRALVILIQKDAAVL